MFLNDTVKTDRLILRPWRKNDFEPFALLNADPTVREFFPSLMTRHESDAQAEAFINHFEMNGWGLWAVEVPGVADFIGFVGLQTVNFRAPFTPAVEIGWRLAKEYWGKGYATEGALASLKYGFEVLELNEIVSFTPTANIRSRHVMEKIGMHHSSKDDFNHPKLPLEHILCRHVLYKIQRNHS